MASKFKIRVFGKTGCDKCKVLNQRIDSLLEKPEWTDFQKEYFDVETEEGLVNFAQAECLNPQRIPAFVVARVNEESGRTEPLLNPDPGAMDELCKKTRLYTWLGLQTDYSETGRGVISSSMITAILDEARRV
ncbi:MAG TPA: hypothetical protein DCZ95_06750 [Verrucomicrobia bacterium]|nr:MAG: hypothetical protein A2X46_10625 [Lentisphaerae bacterium GWF2_57_35]HBA83776.1 hypothetical protein [Verrucomicrobiota bacterium]